MVGQEIANALMETVAEIFGYGRGSPANVFQMLGKVIALLQEFLGHSPAFLLAHGLELSNGLIENALQKRPIFLQMCGAVPGLGDNAGQSQDLAEQGFSPIS